MKILVLCDDYWHPARVPQEGLEPLSGAEFTFDWLENAEDWSLEDMQRYPAVILTKSNNISAADRSAWMTAPVEGAFADYVHQGHGLLAIHSGTAEYEQAPVLRSLLGGVFHHHPDQCPVTVTPLPGHPLSAGISAFKINDEHYFMEMNDPFVDVFVTTTSEHGEQPAGWRRVEGNGRVAVLTPGHNLEIWLYPSFQALVRNCLRWCSAI